MRGSSTQRPTPSPKKETVPIHKASNAIAAAKPINNEAAHRSNNSNQQQQQQQRVRLLLGPLLRRGERRHLCEKTRHALRCLEPAKLPPAAVAAAAVGVAAAAAASWWLACCCSG
ncbi:hypothetical protein ACSSS7_008147 [Eimeria intestinalis]